MMVEISLDEWTVYYCARTANPSVRKRWMDYIFISQNNNKDFGQKWDKPVYNSSPWRQKQEDPRVQASLNYRESSRPAHATQDAVLKIKPN